MREKSAILIPFREI